jgi:hypothetical protein
MSATDPLEAAVLASLGRPGMGWFAASRRSSGGPGARSTAPSPPWRRAALSSGT